MKENSIEKDIVKKFEELCGNWYVFKDDDRGGHFERVAGDQKANTLLSYLIFKEELEDFLSDYQIVLKENEHKTEKIENQKAELAILNEKQKDLNKLQNTLSSYKGQFRRQEKENKKINSLIRKLKKDSKERQWIQTADDEYLAHTEKAMYADELLSFLRGKE